MLMAVDLLTSDLFGVSYSVSPSSGSILSSCFIFSSSLMSCLCILEYLAKVEGLLNCSIVYSIYFFCFLNSMSYLGSSGTTFPVSAGWRCDWSRSLRTIRVRMDELKKNNKVSIIKLSNCSKDDLLEVPEIP